MATVRPIEVPLKLVLPEDGDLSAALGAKIVEAIQAHERKHGSDWRSA